MESLLAHSKVMQVMQKYILAVRPVSGLHFEGKGCISFWCLVALLMLTVPLATSFILFRS